MRKLNRIADQVNQYLVQSERASQKNFVEGFVNRIMKCEIFSRA